MGFSIEKKLTLISDSSKSEISDKKPVRTSSYHLVHTCQKSLIFKKGMVLQNHNFLPFLAKLTFNTTWLKISTHQPLKLCNNVWSWCKDGWNICGLIQGKWLQKSSPIDLHWIRNYGNMHFSLKSFKFLQGVGTQCTKKLLTLSRIRSAWTQHSSTSMQRNLLQYKLMHHRRD